MYLIADSLLKLAGELLASRNPGRPDQAVLRRAISTAYYALFHRLIERSVDQVAGKQEEALRNAFARTFDHGAMKRFARAIANGQPPSTTTQLFSDLSNDLRTLAETFALLQDERHVADYDLSTLIPKARARNAVTAAQVAFRLMDSPSPQIGSFLALLPVAGRNLQR